MCKASAPEFQIAGRKIGPGEPPYVIAEISANHLGSLKRAKEMLVAAKEAGADAAKIQTYTADTITIDHDGPGFVIEGGLWAGRKLYDLYQEAHTPWEWHGALFKKGHELGLTVFSSPFDATAVDFLVDLDAPAYKIASFECIDLGLIRKCAQTGKPLIMSTGMASLGEIDQAIKAAQDAGATQIALLHCVSGYPTPIGESNLRTIPNLAETFGVVAGLSDHTLGTVAATMAIALGAHIIEKHFTMSRDDGGPDAAFSLEPAELARLVAETKEAWSALGQVTYHQQDSEKGLAIYRRSLYAVKDIREGETLTEENVRSIRPGFGLPPSNLPQVLGNRARRAIAKGTPLDWPLVEPADI